MGRRGRGGGGGGAMKQESKAQQQEEGAREVKLNRKQLRAAKKKNKKAKKVAHQERQGKKQQKELAAQKAAEEAAALEELRAASTKKGKSPSPKRTPTPQVPSDSGSEGSESDVEASMGGRHESKDGFEEFIDSEDDDNGLYDGLYGPNPDMPELAPLPKGFKPRAADVKFVDDDELNHENEWADPPMARFVRLFDSPSRMEGPPPRYAGQRTSETHRNTISNARTTYTKGIPACTPKYDFGKVPAEHLVSFAQALGYDDMVPTVMMDKMGLEWLSFRDLKKFKAKTLPKLMRGAKFTQADHMAHENARYRNFQNEKKRARAARAQYAEVAATTDDDGERENALRVLTSIDNACLLGSSESEGEDLDPTTRPAWDDHHSTLEVIEELFEDAKSHDLTLPTAELKTLERLSGLSSGGAEEDSNGINGEEENSTNTMLEDPQVTALLEDDNSFHSILRAYTMTKEEDMTPSNMDRHRTALTLACMGARMRGVSLEEALAGLPSLEGEGEPEGESSSSTAESDPEEKEEEEEDGMKVEDEVAAELEAMEAADDDEDELAEQELDLELTDAEALRVEELLEKTERTSKEVAELASLLGMKPDVKGMLGIDASMIDDSEVTEESDLPPHSQRIPQATSAEDQELEGFGGGSLSDWGDEEDNAMGSESEVDGGAEVSGAGAVLPQEMASAFPRGYSSKKTSPGSVERVAPLLNWFRRITQGGATDLTEQYSMGGDDLEMDMHGEYGGSSDERSSDDSGDSGNFFDESAGSQSLTGGSAGLSEEEEEEEMDGEKKVARSVESKLASSGKLEKDYVSFLDDTDLDFNPAHKRELYRGYRHKKSGRGGVVDGTDKDFWGGEDEDESPEVAAAFEEMDEDDRLMAYARAQLLKNSSARAVRKEFKQDGLLDLVGGVEANGDPVTSGEASAAAAASDMKAYRKQKAAQRKAQKKAKAMEDALEAGELGGDTGDALSALDEMFGGEGMDLGMGDDFDPLASSSDEDDDGRDARRAAGITDEVYEEMRSENRERREGLRRERNAKAETSTSTTPTPTTGRYVPPARRRAMEAAAKAVGEDPAAVGGSLMASTEVNGVVDRAGRDIYGTKAEAARVGDSNSHMVDEEELDPKDRRMERLVRSAVNKVTGNNMEAIAGEVVDIYRSYAHGGVDRALVWTFLRDFDPAPVDRTILVIDSIGLLAAVHTAQKGSSMMALLVEYILRRVDGHRAGYLAAAANGEDMNIGAQRGAPNLVLALSTIMNLGVLGTDLIFQFLGDCVESFTPFDLELVLVVLRNAGWSLRRDSPSGFKGVVIAVKEKAAKFLSDDRSKDEGVVTPHGITGTRVRYLVDTVFSLKNNKGGAGGGSGGHALLSDKTPQLQQIRSVLSNIQRNLKCSMVQVANFGLEDVRAVESTGRWWMVGSAWAGKRASMQSQKAGSKVHGGKARLDDDDTVGKAAETLRMNTGTRRSIFRALVAALDPSDAVARIDKLNLSKSQTRDVCRVIVEAMLQENVYNPYYAAVLASYNSVNREVAYSLRLVIWDRFDQISESPLRAVVNLATGICDCVLNGVLTLQVFKALSVPSLNSKGRSLYRISLSSLLLKCKDPQLLFSQLLVGTHGRGADSSSNTNRENVLLALHKFIRPIATGKASAKKMLGHEVDLERLRSRLRKAMITIDNDH